MLSEYERILAVDIGSIDIHGGVVELDFAKAHNLSEVHVLAFDLRPHHDERPSRERAVEQLGDTLRSLARLADKRDHKIAPIVEMECLEPSPRTAQSSGRPELAR
jgi:hypothetical protein